MIIIKRKYHFYAAHRNEELVGQKCANIHGHTYHVEVNIQVADPNDASGVSILFEDIDGLINPIIKEYDHSFLINIADPLLEVLLPFELKLKRFIGTTSVENLSKVLFWQIAKLLPVISVSVQETESAIVLYKPSVSYGVK